MDIEAAKGAELADKLEKKVHISFAIEGIVEVVTCKNIYGSSFQMTWANVYRASSTPQFQQRSSHLIYVISSFVMPLV